jgi:hypothetical protein
MKCRLIGFLLGALAASASLRGEVLIVTGGGFVGAWDTEIDLANVSSEPVDVALFIEGLPLGAPCPPACNGGGVTVPGHGTRRVLASEFLGETYAGPQMIRVETPQGVPAPVVHARSISDSSQTQFAELPVLRESTLTSLDTSVLVFPGASREDGVYSNLVLQSLGGGFLPTEVMVEVFDAEGHLLGARPLMVSGDAAFHATTVVDVVAFLGVSTLSSGQVRVTRVAGTGTLWGILTTVLRVGALKVNLGVIP